MQLRLDCLGRVCAVNTAYYHDAVSVAITTTPSDPEGQWTVDATKLDVVDKLYTEP